MSYQFGAGASNGPGFLYILQEGKNKRFKVGVSTEVDRRVNDLQSGNARRLKKRHDILVSNMREAEKSAHTYLKKFKMQIREGGGDEWFRGDYSVVKKRVETAAKMYTIKTKGKRVGRAGAVKKPRKPTTKKVLKILNYESFD